MIPETERAGEELREIRVRVIVLPMKRTIGIITAGLVCVLGLLLFHRALMDSGNDMRVYREIGRNVMAEEPSFKSEYPPLMSATFTLISVEDQKTFTWIWIALLAACAAGIAVFGAWRMKDEVSAAFPAAFALTILLLGPTVTLARFDILMLMALFLAWRTHEKERPAESGFWLAIAVAIKLVPILFLPLFLVLSPKGHWKSFLKGFVLGGVASVLFATAVLGPGGLYANTTYMLAYHAERGVQAESLWSGLVLLGGKVFGMQPGIIFDHGAYHLTGAPGWLKSLALVTTLVGVAVITWIAWKRRKAKHPLAALCLALILWSLAASSVLSAQFLVWVVPFLLLYCYERWMQGDTPVPSFPLLLTGTLLVALLTQWVYPTHYEDVLGMNDDALLILNIRNLLLPVLAAMLLWPRQSSTKPKTGRKRSIALPVLSFAAALVLVPVMSSFLWPRWENVRYSFDGTQWEQGVLPLKLAGRQSNLTVEMDAYSSGIHPRRYRVLPDDCLESVEVNGKRITADQFCDPQNGRVVRVGSEFKKGINHVRMTVRDTGGETGLAIVMDPDDVLMQLFGLVWVLAVIAAGSWLIVTAVPKGNLRLLYFAGLGGTALRLLYMLSTQYIHRAYDWDGHLDYVRHVLTHWTIPPAVSGWEMHQAPLYYFLTASLYRAMTFIAASTSQFFIGMLQYVSFLCSAGALFFGIWTVRRLFPKKPAPALLASLIIATFPGLVMFASRISNDSLYHLLAFATLAAIVLWWQQGTRRNAALVGLAFAATFLVKVSVFVMGPVIGACLLLHPRLTWKQKFVHGGIMALLVIVLAAWLPAVRFMEEQTHSITSFGHSSINPGLLMPTTAESFLTFNPVQVLLIPFNNTWDDASRRMYFWEFFYRSAFYGEFNMGDNRRALSQVILLLGMAAAGLMFYGLLRELRARWRETLPLWGTLGLLVLGSMTFRFLFRCSCDQDFRFAIVAVVPIAYFAASSVAYLPKRGGLLAKHVLLALAASSAGLLLSFWLWP